MALTKEREKITVVTREREVLPSGLKPINYDLSIYNIDFKALNNVSNVAVDKLRAATFEGTVIITYKVEKVTDTVHLNAKGLKIISAIANFSNGKTESKVSATSIKYDGVLERVELKLDQEIDPSLTRQLNLEIEYQGFIYTNMNSFYRSKYKKPDGSDAVMLTTQFESTAARMALPCADEPNLKASFDLKITVPESWTALSNMPVLSSKSLGDGKMKAVPTEGLKTVSFERSPVMSTYLLAWAAGEFEYIEAMSSREYGASKTKIPVRVYTTKGLAARSGQIGLKAAVSSVDFYSDLFGIDYPLPKIDCIAVHELAGNAMENFGLISFRATSVLFESQGDIGAESRVSYVVAHEMAHQWFGNLVTMDWWDGLWLNEGFATYCGWLAVDQMHPEWDVFSRFVSEALQMALTLDALRSSHPVEVEVKSGLDIDQIFDYISYLKGASVIRMLSATIGVETFIKGVSLYLKRHAFSNAKTVDLWRALSDVSGVDVERAMGNWTSKIGFPLVSVDHDEEGKITVSQGRFLTSGDVSTEENDVVWWVPLSISTDIDAAPITTNLVSRQLDISSSVSKDGFFKLNKDQIGAYRVSYSEKHLALLSKNSHKLSNKDKVGLLADTRATAFAGVGSTSGLLTLITAFQDESDYFVWSELLAGLGTIRSVWSEQDQAIRNGLSKVTEGLVLPLLDKLTWNVSPRDGTTVTQLRSLVASVAAGIGSKDAVKEAEERFARYVKGDKSAIHPSLRNAIFGAVLRHSSGSFLEEAYEYLAKDAKNPSSVDAGEVAAVALGKVREPKLIQRSLEAIINGGVAAQDVHFLTDQLSFNPDSRKATWIFIKENWDAIHSKFSSNMMLLDRMIRLTLVNYVSEEVHDDIVAFFSNKELDGFDRSLAQALDTVKSKAKWVSRDGKQLEEWLAEHNYL